MIFDPEIEKQHKEKKYGKKMLSLQKSNIMKTMVIVLLFSMNMICFTIVETLK